MEAAMGFMDKLKNRLQMGKGRAKEATGRQTHDPYLEAEGRGDRAAGGAKQVGEHAKDAAKNVKKSFGR
jgi:uncharacterized protein YjbJ (UPF0337 family)